MMFLGLITGLFTPVFASDPCPNNFFFLPHWWEYLNATYSNKQCVITYNFPNDIWAIGLAILDMLLRIGGFVAVISIIIAGVQYIMATGNPEKGSSARKRLTNSLIGLAIVLIASGVVAFLGNTLQSP